MYSSRILKDFSLPKFAPDVEERFWSAHQEMLFRHTRLAAVMFAITATVYNYAKTIFPPFQMPDLLYTSVKIPSWVSIVVAWTVPLIFFLAKQWSSKYFHWIIIAAMSYFIGTRLLDLQGVRWYSDQYTLATGNSAEQERIQESFVIFSQYLQTRFVILYIWFIVFFRIPYRHALAFCLATVPIIEAMLFLYATEANGPYIGISFFFIVALGLITLWKLEERERLIFAKSLDAEAARCEIAKKHDEIEIANANLQRKSVQVEQMNEELLKQNIDIQEAHEALIGKAAELEDARNRLQLTYDAISLEMEQARERAAKSDRAKTEFIREAVHDIRNPIFAIGASLGALRSAIASGNHALQNQAINNIIDCYGLAAELTHNIFDLAGYEMRAIRNEPIDLDLCQFLKKVTPACALAASEKQLRLILRPAPATARYAHVDKHSLERIVVNLLSNAVKFTENTNSKQGRIWVYTRRAQGKIFLIVSDNGVGIAPSRQNLVWEYGKESSTYGTKGEEGTGIGLTLVRAIRDALRLRIDMKSSLGRGTRFTIALPIGETPHSESVDQWASQPHVPKAANVNACEVPPGR